MYAKSAVASVLYCRILCSCSLIACGYYALDLSLLFCAQTLCCTYKEFVTGSLLCWPSQCFGFVLSVICILGTSMLVLNLYMACLINAAIQVEWWMRYAHLSFQLNESALTKFHDFISGKDCFGIAVIHLVFLYTTCTLVIYLVPKRKPHYFKAIKHVKNLEFRPNICFNLCSIICS